jgi:hypothetical protein
MVGEEAESLDGDEDEADDPRHISPLRCHTADPLALSA